MEFSQLPTLPSHTLYFCLRHSAFSTVHHMALNQSPPHPTPAHNYTPPPPHLTSCTAICTSVIRCYLYLSNKTYPLQSLLRGKELMQLPHHAPFPTSCAAICASLRKTYLHFNLQSLRQCSTWTSISCPPPLSSPSPHPVVIFVSQSARYPPPPPDTHTHFSATLSL